MGNSRAINRCTVATIFRNTSSQPDNIDFVKSLCLNIGLQKVCYSPKVYDSMKGAQRLEKFSKNVQGVKHQVDRHYLVQNDQMLMKIDIWSDIVSVDVRRAPFNFE